MFNKYVRGQVQAALEFWVAVGNSSRTHPSEHPQVKVFFEKNGTLPMTNQEIRDLIFTLNAPVPVTTIPLFVAGFGREISEYAVRQEVKFQGIKPVLGRSVYSTSDLLPTVVAIREKYGVK